MSNRSTSAPVRKYRRVVITWLCACALLVAGMVLLGGYTRLSGSGLSITEWKPLHGTLPPLSSAQWEEEFEAYKASPQFRKVNSGMDLQGFKTIFWPEFLHRLLGRLIGVVFFVPWAAFALRGAFSRGFSLRLLGIFALGGLQGGIGWLMVKSGLVDTPYVSPVRLALHLSTALLILGLLIWAVLDVAACHPEQSEGSLSDAGDTPASPQDDKRYPSYMIWFCLLCLQIMLGALVAGSHAGLIYNTWPDMNGHFFPIDEQVTMHLPSGIAFIQFLHRHLAEIVVLGYLFWWRWAARNAKNKAESRLCLIIASLIATQFLLGVLTLLKAAPLHLALTHQAVAMLLYIAATMLLHRLQSRHKRLI